jgi:hypothetical protein
MLWAVFSSAGRKTTTRMGPSDLPRAIPETQPRNGIPVLLWQRYPFGFFRGYCWW